MAAAVRSGWHKRAVGVVLGLAIIGFGVRVVGWNSRVTGQCGPVPARLAATVRNGPTTAVHDALHRLETTGSESLKRMARKARLQCGLVERPDEVVESIALQLTAVKFDFTGGENSTSLFAVSVEARDRLFSTDAKRLDVVDVLKWAIAQPATSMPAEFRQSREAVPDLIAYISAVRSKWKPMGSP